MWEGAPTVIIITEPKFYREVHDMGVQEGLFLNNLGHRRGHWQEMPALWNPTGERAKISPGGVKPSVDIWKSCYCLLLHMKMKAFNERGKKMGYGGREGKEAWQNMGVGWVGRTKLSTLFEWESQRKRSSGDSIFVQEDMGNDTC